MEQVLYDQVVGPVVKFLTGHITKHLGYALCFTKHVTHMTKRMKVLEDTKNDLKKKMETHQVQRKEIPTGVPDWVKAVEELGKAKKEVESFANDGNTCLNMKRRYQAGRKACTTTQRIEELIIENVEFKWNDAHKPMGRLDFKPKSSTTCTPSSSSSSGGNGFASRDRPFNDALKFLQDNKTQVIALCGMGGVGKTTMMEQLKTVANDKGMFDIIVKVVIGCQPNMFSIQNDIAQDIAGDGLHKLTKTARGDRLVEMFKVSLEKQKKRILLILDDVWENINLNNIGLTSPLPNGIKLLLTSRNSDICKQIALNAHSVFEKVEVDILEKAEAQKFFFQITNVSEQDDERNDIGRDIVERCGGLPFALDIIGTTLNEKEISRWKTTLQRLNNNVNYGNVQEVIKISYEYLKDEEDKEVFLLCGLFPEDYDISIENLTRYAWGLNLFEGVSTLGDARDWTDTCVDNLINAHLLIKSDQIGCVKVHDLVLAFVLSEVSKYGRGWVINHGDVPKWGIDDERSKSCKIISLTCKGMSKFPQEFFMYPNLSLLQLMHGDSSLKFPKYIYDNMKKLKLVAYYNMQYPLLPRSLQCSTNLKSLCLHKCELMFDFSFLGDLVNLEVLSFAYCGIRRLPSKIGNLKRLKLLDLTGCVNLRIDNGVFKNLTALEELYMRVLERKAIRFTDANFEELAVLSRQLYALEVEFIEKKSLLENFSFENLEKFKIAIGCLFSDYIEQDSFKNTLKLVSDHSSDLRDCKINKLFKKTELCYLQVEDMAGLDDVSLDLFRNLTDLEVFECANLKYLFPAHVANGLKKLERLKISSCSVFESMVQNDGSEINCIVELPELVELVVVKLPNFTSIYPDNNNIHALLSSQVKIPKLEKLMIGHMEQLKQIWGCEIASSSEEEINNISILREIEVSRCDSLVNLFPTNPMRFLNHLERLEVSSCGSIEEIFNIDLERTGHEVEKLSSSNLRSIEVECSNNLREVCRIKGVESSSRSSRHQRIRGFEAVKRIKISSCKMFRNVFTPTNTTIKFDMSTLTDIHIYMENTYYEKLEEGDINISTVAFPSNLYFHYLSRLTLQRYHCVEVVFEIESPITGSRDLVTTTNNQPLPNLQSLSLSNMKNMTHVWKCCNWNKFLILQKPSSFHNLTTIKMHNCHRIKYLLSPLMAKLLSNLKTIHIDECHGMEEVVSNRDDKDEEMTTSTTYTTTTLFPHLHSLCFTYLKNLKRIGGGGRGAKGTTSVIHDQIKFSLAGVVKWSLCQYSNEIYISFCDVLSSVIPSNALGPLQKLQVLVVRDCNSLIEVFETQGVNKKSGDSSSITRVDEGSFGTHAILSQEIINVPRLSNLKKMKIISCELLPLVFTFSMLECLKQLEELVIESCKAMTVIVKEEDGEPSKGVEFPRLKFLELYDLPNLEGFFLGKNDFKWPLLEKVMIVKCSRITKFTCGQSKTPKLNNIYTGLGKHSLETCGLNFHLKTPQTRLACSECSTSLERLPWSFHNLIELDMNDERDVKCIIPFNELLKLQKLESIIASNCQDVEEVFEVEAMEGTNSELQTVVEIPNLTQLKLTNLSELKYIWKSNHHGRVLKFPNLTTLSIEYCTSLKHVFTSSMVRSLLQLQNLHVEYCEYMEVIFKVEKEEESELELLEGTNNDFVEYQNAVEIPNLTQLKLMQLFNLKYIWKSNHHGRVLKFPNLTTLYVHDCKSLKHVFTGSMVRSLLQLQNLLVLGCDDMEVIVKVEKEEESELELLEGTNHGFVEYQNVVEIPNLRQLELYSLHSLTHIWKSNHEQIRTVKFPNLTTLSIWNCTSLKHVLTSSMVGSLQQLQDLHISNCKSMEEVVFKEEEEEEEESQSDATVKKIVLPCLKSLKLEYLESLKGFCLAKDDFILPSLHNLEIRGCPRIMVFTNGHVATEALDVIDTGFGRCYIRNDDINSFIKNKLHELVGNRNQRNAEK